MNSMNLHIRTTKAVALIVAALGLMPLMYAQTAKKPRQLREEMLQQQQKQSTVQQQAPKSQSRRIQPPQIGSSTLKPATPMSSKDATLVYLEHSNELIFDQHIAPNLQILKGNVRFRHDNALLYCDSAHFNDQANSFDAFGNVRIVQADTLTVYGDFLNYDGNSKLARVWDNVRMVNRNTVLTTDILYYDRSINLAFYDMGGTIEDGNNTLTSTWGQYSPDLKTALFRDKVKMVNPDAIMTTDTMRYNTNTSIADIVGNSLVVYQEETDIYSQRGWYDTKNERMMLLDRSLVEQKDGKTLIGDTIFYDKANKYGEAYSNVELNDPKQKTTLHGNFVSYDEIKQIGLATDSALFVDWSSRDSLFLSADTLYAMRDSLVTDTIAYNKLLAFNHVRFLRTDAQGMCDSLIYTSRDSIMHLIGLPVLWSDNNQIKGKRITAYTKNQKIEQIKIEQSAIAIQHDSLHYYNQLSGKEMIAYLYSGELKQVFVNGNAETIYFPKDEKTGEYIGVNKTVSSYVNMYFNEKKIDRIVLTTASGGAMYPIKDMDENDLYLRNFHWYEVERPQQIEDLYVKYERTEPPARPESTKKPAFPSTGSSDGGTSPSSTTPTDSQSRRSSRLSTTSD